MEKIVREYPDGTTIISVATFISEKATRKNAVESYVSCQFFRNEGFPLRQSALFKKYSILTPAMQMPLRARELSEEKELITTRQNIISRGRQSGKRRQKDELLTIYEKILSLSPSNIPLRIKVAEIFTKKTQIRCRKGVPLYSGITKTRDIQSQRFLPEGDRTAAAEQGCGRSLSCLHEKTGDRESM